MPQRGTVPGHHLMFTSQILLFNIISIFKELCVSLGPFRYRLISH